MKDLSIIPIFREPTSVQRALTLVDLYMEYMEDDCCFEALQDIRGLMKAIEKTPRKLLYELQFKLDKWDEEYAKTGRCPNCDSELSSYRSPDLGTIIHCKVCGWG